MCGKHLGRQTVRFDSPPSILAAASVAGKKEGEGPLGTCFDLVSQDTTFGQSSWEKAESQMQSLALQKALEKASLPPEQVDMLFGGDLLNQCIGSSFAARGTDIPYYGLYGACSTMAESLSLAAMAVEGGYARSAAAVTSSHFASAERQYRLPLEYGGQRTPTAQWTVTGAGAVLLARESDSLRITHVTPGRVVDAGVTDANNMGAAMAPAAFMPVRPGDRVLDLCAAPGGKTIQIAWRTKNKCAVTAQEPNPRRRKRLEENLLRCNIAANVVEKVEPGLFDCVLADVPCSNTGVLRKRPDARWRWKDAGWMPKLGELQSSILAGAAKCVKPGGLLVYSTCSNEYEENAQRVKNFLLIIIIPE